jgi:biotin carboxyl carrier protein
MTYEIEIGGVPAQVRVELRPDGRYEVRIGDGAVRVIEADRVGAAEWILGENGARRSVAVHVAGDVVSAQVNGLGLVGTIVDPRERTADHGAGAGSGVVKSPMPGSIARVLCKVGDPVTKGQVLVVVEAMKMENEFKSPCDGVVAEVPAVPGATVESNAVLVVVGPS